MLSLLYFNELIFGFFFGITYLIYAYFFSFKLMCIHFWNLMHTGNTLSQPHVPHEDSFLVTYALQFSNWQFLLIFVSFRVKSPNCFVLILLFTLCCDIFQCNGQIKFIMNILFIYSRETLFSSWNGNFVTCS